MAKFKNEIGEEFEAFTQEELDAKAKEAADAAAAKAVEDYKTANPQKTPEQLIEEKKAVEDQAKKDAEPIEQLKKTVEGLQATIRARDIGDYAKTYAGADAAKQVEFKAKFDRLTGYPDTQEGIAERAADAAKLIGIDPKTVNIGDVAGTGSGRNVDGAGAVKETEADKLVQKALGISAEDVKKYGAAAQTESNK